MTLNKLTSEQIKKIRQEKKEDPFIPLRQLAQQYNVSDATIKYHLISDSEKQLRKKKYGARKEDKNQYQKDFKKNNPSRFHFLHAKHHLSYLSDIEKEQVIKESRELTKRRVE